MKKLPEIEQFAPLDYETDYQEALAVGDARTLTSVIHFPDHPQ